MLKLINRNYLVFGLIIFLSLFPLWNGEYAIIYILNFITLIAYCTTINQPNNVSENYFTKRRLAWIVFVYLTLFIIVNKLISYYYTDNFFVFSEADAMQYHEGSIAMNSKSFFEGIDYILEKYEYEDLGIFIVVSSLYNIVESNLIISVFYIFVGIITSFSIFRISKNFISAKYSFVCALSYSISSFVIWFHSSGLKESFLVMLVILFYDYYYRFVQLKKIKYLLFSFLILLAFLLFRPAISFLCLASIGISFLLTLKGKFQSFLLIISGLFFIIFIYSYISVLSNRFLLGGTEQMLAVKEASGMVKQGSIQFTYAVNIISSILGPLPTVLPNTKQILSIFSVGLIYRVFTSAAFCFGVYYIIKNKVVIMYPLLLFIVIEMTLLTFILEALELRKSLPHIPFIFIISFWFLDLFDKKDIFTSRQKKRIKIVFNASSVLFFLLILYWNYR